MTPASTVLIVDDQQSVCETVEALLSPEEYRLVFASNGVEALAAAAELRPDLILLDVMMPGMDGFEVCQRLRADPRLAEVPVIMVTALDDHDSRLHGLEVGADDFVSKPFDRAELRARVRTITRLNRYRRLLAERARFEWVIQQASDGYVIVSDGDDVLYANPQAGSFLGLPSKVGEGEPGAGKFLELVKAQYQCEPPEAWAGWPAASPQMQRCLVQPESPTRKAFWLQVEVLDLPFGPAGERLIRLRDVTAQMNLQHEVWGFHSAISHKLRTPLVIVLNSLELQARHMTDLSREETAQLSEMALRGVQRLCSDVGDILQYLNAPILAGPGEGFRVSRLPQIVAEISAYLGLKAVTTSIAPELNEASIALSERGVELVLWEILENAKKFHPAQAPNVQVLASGANGRVSLQVRDDGLTLSAAQLARAWMPYYQGEKYFTGQTEGMGLGLAMVASLVWNVGGTCRMYNREDGPGIVVELVLPVTCKDTSAREDDRP